MALNHYPVFINFRDYRIYSVAQKQSLSDSFEVNQEKHIVEKLGRRIRKFRLLKGWSQMYLAAEARLDKTYIGSIERGEVNPSIRKIARIADALGVRIVVFFEDQRT